MRLTLWLLGTEVFAVELGQPAAEAEADEYVDAGTTGHYPVTFAAAHEMPDEAALVDHNNGWGDEGNRVGFRP